MKSWINCIFLLTICVYAVLCGHTTCHRYTKTCPTGCPVVCIASYKQCYLFYQKIGQNLKLILGGCIQQRIFMKEHPNNSCHEIRIGGFACFCSGQNCNSNARRYLRREEMGTLTFTVYDYGSFEKLENETNHEDVKSDKLKKNVIIITVSAIFVFGGFIVKMSCKIFLCLKRSIRQPRVSIKADSDQPTLITTGSRQKSCLEDGNTPKELDSLSNFFAYETVNFMELIYKGRSSQVWKVSRGCHILTAKISTTKHQVQNEKRLFQDYQLKHENIIRFVHCLHQAVDNLKTDVLLFEYHPNGDLLNFLKFNIVPVSNALPLLKEIISGVAYLHSENMNTTPRKYRIAHRDIKSSNILMKSDTRCCLADFECAYVFIDHRNFSNKEIEQVGTLRYLPPEVLAGTTDFDEEAFFQADMYSTALVMWELLSRCCYSSVDDVPSYMAPYENKVGRQPNVNDLESCVLQQNYRPEFRPIIWKDEELNFICKTIQDCWDEAPTARLTADCVYERLSSLM